MTRSSITAGFRSEGHRTLLRECLALGLKVRDTGAHVLVYPPDGTRPVALSRTAYDGAHGTVTARTALRRHGAALRKETT